MLLYTPLSYEEIFPGEEDRHQLVVYNGRPCYVKKRDDETYELVQLISTDPYDFLRIEFTPGTIIKR